METVYIKEFSGTPFSIEIVSVENSPGTWNSSRISICREESSSVTVIGEYIRNYPSYSKETFYPFRSANGNWYALYSSHYTSTRVMKLDETSIEDWCGEEPNPHGFCPTEFYIPKYHSYSAKLQQGDKTSDYDYYLVDNECDNDAEFEKESANCISTKYCDFAFMSGCVWGDDNSWKLRYIDLSAIDDKVLTITDKFGYWELPRGFPLRKCINMNGWEPSHSWVELTRMEHVNLKTGERC